MSPQHAHPTRILPSLITARTREHDGLEAVLLLLHIRGPLASAAAARHRSLPLLEKAYFFGWRYVGGWRLGRSMALCMCVACAGIADDGASGRQWRLVNEAADRSTDHTGSHVDHLLPSIDQLECRRLSAGPPCVEWRSCGLRVCVCAVRNGRARGRREIQRPRPLLLTLIEKGGARWHANLRSTVDFDCNGRRAIDLNPKTIKSTQRYSNRRE